MRAIVRSWALRMLASAWLLLPRSLSAWPRAMAREMAEIPRDGAALLFAAGCFRAIGAMAVTGWLESLAAAGRRILLPLAPLTWSPDMMRRILERPRLLGLLCGAVAVALGLVHMALAGAPSRYLMMNLAALVLGATAWLTLGRTAEWRHAGAGAGFATLALAVPLLATALFGLAIDGAARWARVGPFNLQVSLIVLPIMLLLYARKPDASGTIGMIVAALALALQPDRGMAGVLMLALVALLLVRRGPLPALAAAASAAAFGWTFLTPDRLPAVPYVDRILYTAFDVHPLAGLAVVAGALALVLPTVIGLRKGAGDRSTLLVFGGCWLGVVIAAALGNSPTPLVGYGGSAILGYLLSVAMLPNGRSESRGSGTPATPPIADAGPGTNPDLRIAHPA